MNHSFYGLLFIPRNLSHTDWETLQCLVNEVGCICIYQQQEAVFMSSGRSKYTKKDKILKMS